MSSRDHDIAEATPEPPSIVGEAPQTSARQPTESATSPSHRDPKISDGFPDAIPAPAPLPEDEPIEELKNASSSTESGTTRSSDLADESALQRLNV